MDDTQLHWSWKRLPEMSAPELYDILRERQQVFVVDYNSANLDADGIDPDCLHLSLRNGAGVAGNLVAYLRLVPPGRVYDEPAIGRVLTTAAYRAQGFGKRITEAGIARARELWPAAPVRISAQTIYESFYQNLGFTTVSDPYVEEGMPHVQMLLPGGR